MREVLFNRITIILDCFFYFKLILFFIICKNLSFFLRHLNDVNFLFIFLSLEMKKILSHKIASFSNCLFYFELILSSYIQTFKFLFAPTKNVPLLLHFLSLNHDQQIFRCSCARVPEIFQIPTSCSAVE